ncbi:MAG: hypothetical protein HZA88_01920 [Verrucomicrobia bacterium]|nr:hypothetical protein [Verrucomicrobiota bacterium]
MKRSLRVSRLILIGLVLSFLAVVAVPPLDLPWCNGFYGRSTDIDIVTGRLRYSRYVLWIPVRQTVENSVLTKALPPEEVKSAKPEWHIAKTEPHWFCFVDHMFGGAPAVIQQLKTIWELGSFTPAAKSTTVKTILQLWQRDHSYRSSSRYVDALGELALARQNKSPIDVAGLPPAPTQLSLTKMQGKPQ